MVHFHQGIAQGRTTQWLGLQVLERLIPVLPACIRQNLLVAQALVYSYIPSVLRLSPSFIESCYGLG